MDLTLYILKVTAIFTRNYIYILSDNQTGETVILDPVWDRKGIEYILEKNKLILNAVLLTHHHPDHVHLADELAVSRECPVYMSGEEISFYNFSCHNLLPVEHAVPIHLKSITITPLLTPGHTRGSMCFLIDNYLFTGDTLFTEGCGFCCGRGADPADMFRSLQLLKQQIPLQTKIYPSHSYGHEPGKFFSEVLKINIYLDFKNEEEFIKYRMRKNQKTIFAFK